jgi:hypothetical protein
MSNGNKKTLEDKRQITVRNLFEDLFAGEESDSAKNKPACDIY